jgi:hypothetical protein
MRKLLPILVVFPLWFIYNDGGLYAQNDKDGSGSHKKEKSRVHSKKYAQLDPRKEYILRMDDKMYIRKHGVMTEVNNDEIAGGLQVAADGRVTKHDGSYVMLQEGEAITMDGKLFLFDQHQVIPDRMNNMKAIHASSMSEHRKSVDMQIAYLNQKISLLVNMNNLLNEKMALMNELGVSSNSKKMSKERMASISRGIEQINHELSVAEERLEEIDSQMAKNVSDKNPNASNKR